jgi:heptosyltransferase I
MRILIVKLSAIGDCIHTLPAVASLKRAMPEAYIAWAAEPKASAILQGSPVIDELIEVDKRIGNPNQFRSARLTSLQTASHSPNQESLSQGFDVAIDFQGLLKSGLVARASQAPRRMGFETPELREKFSRLFLTEQVQTSSIAHVIEKNLALARAVFNKSIASDATGDYEFPIAIAPEDEEYVNATVLDRTSRFAILNPGGGWVTKLWAAKNFGAVADWLWENYQLTSLVTYGPGEEILAQQVAQNSRTEKAIPFSSTLKQFAVLARRAELFVGGDTGPLHLAAACRTPIVGLYGPTSPVRNGPFDQRDITVGRDLWCREKCHRRDCWHWQCMEISFDEVVGAISQRLRRADINPRSTKQSMAFKV